MTSSYTDLLSLSDDVFTARCREGLSYTHALPLTQTHNHTHTHIDTYNNTKVHIHTCTHTQTHTHQPQTHWPALGNTQRWLQHGDCSPSPQGDHCWVRGLDRSDRQKGLKNQLGIFEPITLNTHKVKLNRTQNKR